VAQIRVSATYTVLEYGYKQQTLMKPTVSTITASEI